MNKNVEIRKAERQDVPLLMDGIILAVGEVERLDVGEIRKKTIQFSSVFPPLINFPFFFLSFLISPKKNFPF